MNHLMGIQEGVSYGCNQCQYKATQQGDRTKHILAVHEVVRYVNVTLPMFGKEIFKYIQNQFMKDYEKTAVSVNIRLLSRFI